MDVTDHPLNVTIVNQFLRNNVTVTLQWPQEAGAVYYYVNVSPEVSYTSHSSIVISLMISYNTQYNVSIVSSLCEVTTTKMLKYGKCEGIILLNVATF